MRILIEGEKYGIDSLSKVFDDSRFYSRIGDFGIITHVGYYHSLKKNELIYFLPKVFLVNNKVFGEYTIERLFHENIKESFKHAQEYIWVRQLLILFYNSLREFKRRYLDNSIIEASQSLELNTNLDLKEYTYLDLVLSFINYYKKNKNNILFHHVDNISNQIKKTNWQRTINKSVPIINEGKVSYVRFQNTIKKVNYEEELFIYFFSILNHFKKEHDLSFSIDRSYKIIAGNDFEKLKSDGLKRLKKIKYKFFSDVLKRMYQLCELYFTRTSSSGIKRKNEEYISVKNYNIIFEDMVDKLFSDNINSNIKDNSISLENLKFNKDGKIIDHIYEYTSLIDTTNIFYIGDSKYYKSQTYANELSIYKQFTYAKNVVQFNIDLFNNTDHYYSPRIRYRDELTEGYNISPNFFIYGYINNFWDFDNSFLESYGVPKKSFHFVGRLFDRDTLFLHQYQINFLFILKMYTTQNSQVIEAFRRETKLLFRNKFIEYFNEPSQSGYEIFEKKFDKDELIKFVNANFRRLNGKCISIEDNILIIAVPISDEEDHDLLRGFERKELK